MTNKTELLPCPCCGGDAKEMYTYLTSVEWVACLKCGLETRGFGNAEAAAKAWNTRAAPAEDVRAVVEEPVYLYRRKGFDSWATCDRKRFEMLSDHQCFEVDTLYRHPQRPVLLPERRSDNEYIDEPISSSAWNACIDECERLNKC